MIGLMSTRKTITLYGIPNCSTVKKARSWLKDYGASYQFHDFKTSGVPVDNLQAWIAAVGWERLINRQGTTWRTLVPEQQAAVVDAASASALMLAQPSVIKRPVVDWGDATTVGFDPLDWQQRLG